MIRGRFILIAFLIAVVYWAPNWMPVSADRDASETAAAENAVREERLLRDAQRRRDSLSPEQRALFDELASARSDISKAKVREKLVKTLERDTPAVSFYDWAASAWRMTEQAYEDLRPRAERWLWSFAILTAGVGVLAAVTSQTRIARLTARLGLVSSRVWLVVLSFVAMALAMGTRVNPWPVVPHELVFAPIAALLGCGIALKLVDFNFPVWNSLIRGCGAPVISMAFITIYLKLV